MTQPPNGREGRSPMAIAATWGSRITTIALEMVVPGLIGFWIDSRLGTKVLFGMVGFAFGLTLGVWHLVQMAKADDRPPQSQHPSHGGGTALPGSASEESSNTERSNAGRIGPGQSGLGSGETGSGKTWPQGPSSGGPQ